MGQSPDGLIQAGAGPGLLKALTILLDLTCVCLLQKPSFV